MKFLRTLLLSASLLSGFAHAQSLSVLPSATVVGVGDTFTVDLVVSGLDGSLAIGTYDLDLGFDPSVVRLFGVSFGNGLDVLELGSLFTVSSSGFGSLNLYELSFDTPDDLALLQPDSFTLVTLSFKALAQGVSGLSLGVNALGDAFGDALLPAVLPSSVTVVPEPHAYALLLAGLGLVGLARRRA
ncbi:cohesin domain-containing protein [Methyloversatilis thermotolerans]|uniref:cohesin domain-containing protein n=1 Tax=Methyloversatilis thermotolerans TaxID=1346290 RepID=UPI00036EB7C8|nr:cohesin domain-containing protein [Methyloversatilis thermotolerans]